MLVIEEETNENYSCLLMVMEIHQPWGSPECEIPIIHYIVWNRSPIRSIGLVSISSYRFSLDLIVTKKEKCICFFEKRK